MKIALVAGYAPSLVNFRGPLIKAMINAGHEVLAVAPQTDDETPGQIRSLGAEFRPVTLARSGLNPLADLKTLFALISIFRQEKPEILLSYTVKPVIYASLAAKLCGLDRAYSLITGLGYSFGRAGEKGRGLLTALVRNLYRTALSGNRAVFFQNPDDRDFFLQQGIIKPSKPTVVTAGSGIDLDHFALAEPVEQGPVFLCLTRLLREKGVAEYAEAALLLRKKYPEAKFRLVGPLDPGPDGVSEQEVINWVEQEAIAYDGEVRDVRPFMAGCSVFVLPTAYREGVPRSLLEALSMGKPVITTDAPGCRETVVQDENGLLVPVRDPKALADAMDTFIRDRSLIPKMGTASRRLAEEKFDVNKVNGQILGEMGLK